MRAKGGCHCGRVAFEVVLPGEIRVQHCNCSICSMLAYVHLIVPAASFTLLRGAEHLREYRFNTGTARHLFCSHCGVKSFYVPRSNPDGFSINLRCLDLPAGVHVVAEQFDGRNWELHADSLQHLSQPPD
jgi:hypothetical protein